MKKNVLNKFLKKNKQEVVIICRDDKEIIKLKTALKANNIIPRPGYTQLCTKNIFKKLEIDMPHEVYFFINANTYVCALTPINNCTDNFFGDDNYKILDFEDFN